MSGKRIPETLVEVICEGCVSRGEKITSINVRIRAKDNGKRTIQCHRCLHLIETYVFSGGQVTVYQSDQRGAGRHETGYEKVWQE